MHFRFLSFFWFRGMHLMVALVSRLIFNSVSVLPSHPHFIKPPLDIIDLNSLKSLTVYVLDFLNSNAWLNNELCIYSNRLIINFEAPSILIFIFLPLSLLAIVNSLFLQSRMPISILIGTPFISHSLNLYPGEIFSLSSK